MLVLLLGVSCSGKTTLMNILCSRDGWLLVRTETTRKVRAGEREKQSVSADVFRSKAADDFYYSTNFLYDAYYGSLRSDIDRAVATTELWILDIREEDRDRLFGQIPHQAVKLVPESIHQLEKQIAASGRVERKSSILREFLDQSQKEAVGVPLILNPTDSPESAADTMVALFGRMSDGYRNIGLRLDDESDS